MYVILNTTRQVKINHNSCCTNRLGVISNLGCYRALCQQRETLYLIYSLRLCVVECHLSHNVEQRRLVMEDIRTAKMLQDEEDKRAKIFTLDQQEEM